MHVPAIYINENPAEINEFLQKNSFGIFVNLSNNKLKTLTTR